MATYDEFIERYYKARGDALDAALIDLTDVIKNEPDGVLDEEKRAVYIVLPGSETLTVLYPTSSTENVPDSTPPRPKPAEVESADQAGAVHNVSSSDQGHGHSHG